jgi:hypothetical protein
MAESVEVARRVVAATLGAQFDPRWRVLAGTRLPQRLDQVGEPGARDADGEDRRRRGVMLARAAHSAPMAMPSL